MIGKSGMGSPVAGACARARLCSSSAGGSIGDPQGGASSPMARPARSQRRPDPAALARLVRAEALAAQGQLDAAMREAAAFARHHPQQPEAWRLKGALALL